MKAPGPDEGLQYSLTLQGTFAVPADMDLNEALARIRGLEAENKALRETGERYRRIVAMVTDYAYSFRIDDDGRITLEWFTGEADQITGYTIDELVKRGGPSTVIHPEDQERVAERTHRLLAGMDHVTQVRILRKDGGIHWVRDHGHPEWDTDLGRTVRIYGAATDVTWEHELDSQYVALFEEMAEAFALYEIIPGSRRSAAGLPLSDRQSRLRTHHGPDRGGHRGTDRP